jgi:uncharacterized delta-60 repeat protein
VTSDGGYIIAGSTQSFGAGGDDIYLIKTDSEGNMLWNQTYGGTGYDYGNSVQVTSDGGYIIAGQTNSFGAGAYDVYLIKTDSEGNMLWNQTYGSTNRDEGHSVQVTSDGGYIIAGSTQSFGAGGDDIYLIKTDSEGNMLWNQTYGGPDDDGGSSVQVTSDGGYIIAGYTYSFGAGKSDVYLIKTDSEGNMLWNQTYGGTGYDYGNSVQVTSDGGHIISGYSSPSGPSGYDFYLVKTDSGGNMLWSQTYGGTTVDRSFSVQVTSDGGYIISGSTASWPFDESDVYLVKTDSEGNMLWSQTYGGTGYDGGFSVQVTSDGGYIIAGSTYSFGAGKSDVYLIKVQPPISQPITTTTSTTTKTTSTTSTTTKTTSTTSTTIQIDPFIFPLLAIIIAIVITGIAIAFARKRT